MPIKPRLSPAPKALSIEECRERYRQGSLDLAIAEIKELEKLKGVAKDQTNAANRQSTQAKNAFKALAIAEDLEGEDEIVIGGMAYRFDVSHAEVIDPEGLLKLFEAGKIKRDAFINAISVTKTNAEKWIGAHMLLKLTQFKDGDTLDIRARELEVPVKAPALVRKQAPAPQKKLLASTDAPPKPILKAPAKLNKPVRRINLK